ncbi:MAG: cell division protein FtsZ [Pseudomonadota bacterium]
MFELVDSYSDSANIKVVGVGGGGGNAVAHMLQTAVDGVDFICANTDVQALKKSQARVQLQIGANITKGLGAGANPELGRQAALEDRDRIQEVLSGTDMLFVTTGMGGGTGTGAAPVIAQIARDMGILTVAVVTKPFPFEGKKRMEQAMNGIHELEKHVDSLIVIPNEKLLAVMGKSASLMDAFNAANDVLLSAVQGISELITRPGLINVDFADVRTVMEGMGASMMGTGVATGDDRAREAAEAAIHSPFLEDIELRGARGILVNVTAGPDLTIGDYNEIGEIIREMAAEEANVKIGTAIDMDMTGEIRVTVVATGLIGKEAIQAERPRVVVNNERAQPRVQEAPQSVVVGNTALNLDLVDIPAFLRRQAD